MGISEKLRRLIIVRIYIFYQQGSPGGNVPPSTHDIKAKCLSWLTILKPNFHAKCRSESKFVLYTFWIIYFQT
jgi:hypothetical protein